MLSKSEARRLESNSKVYVQYDENSRGLFASVDIRQGETVLKLPEKTVPEPDMYSIEVFSGVHVDCSDSLVGAMNHACKANCRVRDGRIVAWECITAGEELTINYRLTETHLAVPFVCKDCGQEMKW